MSSKKSFVLYADYIHTFNALSNEEAGVLIKHVLAFVNGVEFVENDKIIKVAFGPIQQQLIRDLESWEEIKKVRSMAGKASASKRKQQRQQVSTKPTRVNTSQQTSTNPTVNVNVTSNNILLAFIINKYPILMKMAEPLTEVQADALLAEFDRDLIKETIQAMANKKSLLKDYVSTNLTLRNWMNRAAKTNSKSQNPQGLV